jgi:hypothetical protein
MFFLGAVREHDIEPFKRVRVKVERECQKFSLSEVLGAQRSLCFATTADEAKVIHAEAILIKTEQLEHARDGSPSGSPRAKRKGPQLVRVRAFAMIWWRIRDSNPGPADYDSVALTG